MKAAIIFAFAITASLHAQEFLPELQPSAAKYKADVTTLEDKKTAVISRARATYLAALDATERSATAAGQLLQVAAITREREAVNGDRMSPTAPSDLPKSIQPARQAYQAATTKAAADLTTARQRVDADYLRALATLQSRASANPELAKQLAAEKAFLLQNRPRPKNVPPDAKMFNGKWYRTYLGHCSWKEARDKCVRDGGQLAIIPDEQTQSFISDLASGVMCWLGASNDKAKRGWTWVDGTPMTYTAWARNQPDNFGGIQHYLIIVREGRWDDLNEDHKSVAGYICEWR